MIKPSVLVLYNLFLYFYSFVLCFSYLHNKDFTFIIYFSPPNRCYPAQIAPSRLAPFTPLHWVVRNISNTISNPKFCKCLEIYLYLIACSNLCEMLLLGQYEKTKAVLHNGTIIAPISFLESLMPSVSLKPYRRSIQFR